jgi:hypothetical protein
MLKHGGTEARRGIFLALVKYGLKVRKFRFKNPHLSGIIFLSDSVDGQPIEIGGKKGCWISWKEAP